MNATVTALHSVRPAPSRSDRATDRRAGLRLTRRGRIVVSAISFLAVLAVGAAVLLLIARPAASASGGAVESVAVESGETVWDMAVERGAEDPSAFVHDVRMLNNLSGTGVTAGTSVLVPAAAAD